MTLEPRRAGAGLARSIQARGTLDPVSLALKQVQPNTGVSVGTVSLANVVQAARGQREVCERYPVGGVEVGEAGAV